MHWASYDIQDSENDLLSEFFHQCRLTDIPIRMEVAVPSSVHRSKRMRADCAIYKDGKIFALVEGKAPGHVSGPNSRQRRAYESVLKEYGIKTHWLNSRGQITPLINQLLMELF